MTVYTEKEKSGLSDIINQGRKLGSLPVSKLKISFKTPFLRRLIWWGRGRKVSPYQKTNMRNNKKVTGKQFKQHLALL